eukprot:13276088-Heterocapsa_arctica.AAC.1
MSARPAFRPKPSRHCVRPTQSVSKPAKPRQLGNLRYTPRARYRTLQGVGRIVMLPSPHGLCNCTCRDRTRALALNSLCTGRRIANGSTCASAP